VSDTPDKKADLDKEGILFEDKAELDSGGIPLSDVRVQGHGEKGQVAEQKGKTRESGKPKKTIPIVLASVGLVIIISLSAALWYFSSQKDSVYAPDSSVVTINQPVETYTPENDIMLDPFMVLYSPKNKKRSGILIAQLSLHIAVGMAANVESNIYEIRNHIFNRLSTNADVYTKKELGEMIREDLKDLNVKDVSFIQYEMR